MNLKNSVMNRIIIGKSMGFIVGGLVFFLLPVFGVPLELKFGLGLWFFYIILGVLTAFMGIMDYHPMLKIKMPFWFRGAFMGLMMHILLVLLAYDKVTLLVHNIDLFGMQSPWWVLVDGFFLGILMEWVETKFAGEGNLPLA